MDKRIMFILFLLPGMILMAKQTAPGIIAIKAGVPIAAGSDEYYNIPGMTRGQASLRMFRAYAEAGMTPLQIIQAATVNNAELLGWETRVGMLEKGKYADIIAVKGDPLKDIRELESVLFVMKGGFVYKNEMKK